MTGNWSRTTVGIPLLDQSLQRLARTVSGTDSPQGHRLLTGRLNRFLTPFGVRLSAQTDPIPEFDWWGAGSGPLRPTTGDSTDLSDPTAGQTSKKRGNLGIRRDLRSPFACQIWRNPRNLFVTAVLESGAPCRSPHLLPHRHPDPRTLLSPSVRFLRRAVVGVIPFPLLQVPGPMSCVVRIAGRQRAGSRWLNC